jgi:predicted amidohydrolase
MRVACIQPKAFDLSAYKEGLAYILQKIDEASKFHPKLIVIPECVYPSYYLGLDETKLAEAMALVDEVVSCISNKARKYQTYIAFGLVLEENGQLYNRGLLFDPDGVIIGEVNKSFMWHFDTEWFSSKESTNIIDTPYGKWGMIRCADGRMPEIVRDLALKGVDLVIDLANLTSTGKDSTQLTNAQSNFMLSTRALENNVWLIMADKVGVEAHTVTYSGRSSIISPDGTVRVEASPHKEEIIFADIDLSQKGSLRIDVIKDRQVSTYHSLAKDIDTLSITSILEEKITPSNLVIQGSCVQFVYKNQEEYLAKAKFYIQTLENQMSDLIVLPGLTEDMAQKTLQSFIRKDSTFVLYSAIESTDEDSFISLYCLTKNSVECYRKTHLTASEKKIFQQGDQYKVIQTTKGNIGLMLDEEGYFPEVSRILTLHGADCIVWINNLDSSHQEKIARTRAAENKLFVLTANQLNQWEDATSFITDPNGNIIASTLVGKEQATSTQIPLILSRCKNIVPGTNAILNRKPKTYTTLTL